MAVVRAVKMVRVIVVVVTGGGDESSGNEGSEGW